jgi:hypothetical protein
MATFDPNSITPSEELLEEWYESPQDPFIHDNELRKDYILAARWGARQAAEALRHQWPEPITDRPPTEKDGDGNGLVQYLSCDKWNYGRWNHVATLGYCWLHTSRWRPKPEPTLKQQALEILFWDNAKTEITHEQVLTLRAAVALIPEEDD